MNSWAVLVASREPTFPFNVTCVGQVGRVGMPLASPIFCRFFKTIHDPLSEIPCPLGPNVNRWAALKTSTQPTFRVFVTCVGPVGRLGIPLASPIFGGFFEKIHDPLSATPCPQGPNVNSWDALGASREPTFPLTRPVWADWACHWILLWFADFLGHSRTSQFITLPPRAKCE